MHTNEPLHKILENDMRSRISNMQSGDKIPTEHELCKEFSVSRHTVNKVISRLTEQGLLYRIRRQGTFVSNRSLKRKTVTMLLPGPGTLSRKNDHALNLRELLCGLVDEGRRLGLSVNTMITTDDHCQESLNPEEFNSFTEEDNVLITSHWWSPIFKAISDSGCKTVYRGMMPDDEESKHLMRNWYILQSDTVGTAERIVNYYAAHGRKNILCFGLINGYTREDPIVTGYKLGLERNRIPFRKELMPDFDFRKYSNASIKGDIKPFLKIIKKKLSRAGFDAAIIPSSSFCKSIMSAFQELSINVPEDVAVISTSDSQELLNIDPPVSSFTFNAYSYGVEAARLFARNEFTPGEKVFTADFRERASSQINKKTMEHSETKHIDNQPEETLNEDFIFI